MLLTKKNRKEKKNKPKETEGHINIRAEINKIKNRKKYRELVL